MRTPTRLVSAVLLATYLPLATGCHKTVVIPPALVEPNERAQIVGVMLDNGARLNFPGGVRIERDTVYWTTPVGPRALPMDSVNHFLVRKGDAVKTFFAVVGVAALALGVAGVIYAATKESCPFVYSWDGERWVFDAEPFGGATSRGLERDDYGVLEHLRPVNGEYRLLLTNEVNESQMTNLMRLVVVDHPPEVRPIPDEFGRLHTVASPRSPARAYDQHGADLLFWLKAADEAVWEPRPALDGAVTRDTITLVFTKPPGAQTMKLVARVATGSWGSHQIRSLLALHGDSLDAWYHHIDSNPAAADSVRRWSIREGLYGLPIEVREPDGWRTRGVLAGGGPFIAEDRVVPLDVSQVPGETVELRLLPARSFWGFNWFGVDFSADRPLLVDTVPVATAVDRRLGDVRALLSGVDDQYHPLPETGDFTTLTFKAPPERRGTIRTVILHARGWYQLRGLPSQPKDRILLDRVINEPGFAARLAADEYRRLLMARRN